MKIDEKKKHVIFIHLNIVNNLFFPIIRRDALAGRHDIDKTRHERVPTPILYPSSFTQSLPLCKTSHPTDTIKNYET